MISWGSHKRNPVTKHQAEETRREADKNSRCLELDMDRMNVFFPDEVPRWQLRHRFLGLQSHDGEEKEFNHSQNLKAKK